MYPVKTITVNLPEPNIKEIKRYARHEGDAEIPLDACLKETENLKGRVSYCEFDISFTDEETNLGFAKTSSKDLRKNLNKCKKIILFAATVGFEIDRMIEKYNRISPVKALLMQAIGAERAEACCDTFNEMMKKEYSEKGSELRPRFSCGYGDLPLALQKDIMTALDCQKNLGIILNENLLMMPSKSVTAIIGIKDRE